MQQAARLLLLSMHNARMDEYPMRINKYLAHKKLCTRREADAYVSAGKVKINGRPAVLGDKVQESDDVRVSFRTKKYRYFAYNKPLGVISHSAQDGETEIKELFPIQGVFPVGRLDKDSFGLIILTDDGRLTEALLNPAHEHEKEYLVTTIDALPTRLKNAFERGIDIGLPGGRGQGLPGQGGYTTKPARIRLLGPKRFTIVLTEGKKHQIRRMCGSLGMSAISLQRVLIENILLLALKPGTHRRLAGAELEEFLKRTGLS